MNTCYIHTKKKQKKRFYALYSTCTLFILFICIRFVMPARASGCTDPYDDNGSSIDNLADHLFVDTVPVQLNRSLCGFYDADYVEFPTQSNTTYHIAVLNHENLTEYGVYLELWERQDAETYDLLLTTEQGVASLNTPTNVSNNLIVRVASQRGETGGYGGG